MKKLNKKGFTLAELLIVVAIIAVLVAISIPVFSSQLEKSREAVDAANLRAAYAEVLSGVVSGDETVKKEVVLKQTKEGWQTTFDFAEDLAKAVEKLTPEEGATWEVSYSNDAVVVTAK